LRSQRVPQALHSTGHAGGPLRHCGDSFGLSQSGLVQGPHTQPRSQRTEPPEGAPVCSVAARMAAEAAAVRRLVRPLRVVGLYSSSPEDPAGV